MRKANTSCKGFDGSKVLYLWDAVLDNVIGGLFYNEEEIFMQ